MLKFPEKLLPQAINQGISFSLLSLAIATGARGATVEGSVKFQGEGEGRAVAYLTGIEERGPSSRGKITMRQKNADFTPRVLPITVGDTVYFKNDDEMNHNVWSVSKTKSFDLGFFAAPVEKPVTFNDAGLVKVFCNVHPNMLAYVLVLKNRKFASVGKDGKFGIPNVPKGNYTLNLWSEGAEIQRRPIRVAGATVSESFVVKTAPPPVHLNKFGKPYNP